MRSLATRLTATALAALTLTSACVNESYDGVPIDLSYSSTLRPGFEFGGATVDAFGIAIGFTRIHACESDEDPTVPWAQRLRGLLLQDAHAHSPSTPTSSGIPVLLATSDSDSHDLVSAGLRPPRGGSYCSVEIQLLAADDDTHLLDRIPEVLRHASIARLDGAWVGAAAGRSRIFVLDDALIPAPGQTLHIALDHAALQAELALVDAAGMNPQALSEALQDAAMDALTLQVMQGE